MRVVAFSCCHLCTEETQQELYDKLLDYTPVHKLMGMVIADPPDILVNLGDFTEPVYEKPDLPTLLPEWVEVQNRVKFIAHLMGNHEAGFTRGKYQKHWEFDDVRYEHGHHQIKAATNGKQFDTPELYNEAIRRTHEGQRLVHGHTHIPYTGNGGWPVDIGSVTHSGTYGEILDGVPYIRTL